MKTERKSLFCSIVLALQCAVVPSICVGQSKSATTDAASNEAQDEGAAKWVKGDSILNITLPSNGKVDIESLHNGMGEFAKQAIVSRNLVDGAPEPKPATLYGKPIFRWANPERSTIAGNMYLWTVDGRPQATLCVWCRRVRTTQFEMQSFSESTFTATLPDQSWTPKVAGLKFAELPKASAPDKGASRRAYQMRKIMLKRFRADQFKFKQTKPQKLRLLTTPIYKYEKMPEGVIDGAMFSFAMGTDPEVLVILEARQAGPDSNAKWFYAFAPSTMVEVKGYLDDEQIFRSYHQFENNGSYMSHL